MAHDHEWVSVTDPDTQELLGWVCRSRNCAATKNANAVETAKTAYSAHMMIDPVTYKGSANPKD